MELHSLLISLENELKGLSAPILDLFRPGLSRNEIVSGFERHNLVAPEDLITLYGWKNGVTWEDVPTGKLEFGPSGIFMPLEEALDAYHDLIEYTSVELFPVFFEEVYSMNINSSSPDFGKIYLYSPTLIINEPTLVFESLSKMMEAYVACFEEKAIFCDEDGYFDQDYDLSRIICKRLNPTIAYWFKTSTI